MDGSTVEVTVASSDVRRLMNDNATRIAQNRGPGLNGGGPESDDSGDTVVVVDFIVLSMFYKP